MMLIEKYLSVGAIGIGLALAGPDALAILRQQRHEGSAGMLVGGLIGALGVWGGVTVANACSNRWARAFQVAVWATAAILLTVAVGLGAAAGDDGLLRIGLGLVSVLPGALVAFVVLKAMIANRRSRS